MFFCVIELVFRADWIETKLTEEVGEGYENASVCTPGSVMYRCDPPWGILRGVLRPLSTDGTGLEGLGVVEFVSVV